MSLRERFETTLEGLSWVEPEEVGATERRLLCHERDMTSTLAEYHGGEVTLEVLGQEQNEGNYLREVILSVGDRQVEYGLIEIHLGHLPGEVQARVLTGMEPFGGILNDSGLSYRSEPVGFFRASDSEFSFGRYNNLLDAEGRVLARIIEILPKPSL